MEESDDMHAALALMYGYAARYAPSAVIEARIDALVGTNMLSRLLHVHHPTAKQAVITAIDLLVFQQLRTKVLPKRGSVQIHRRGGEVSSRFLLRSHRCKPKRVLCYDEKDGKVRKECVFDGNYRMYAYIESLVSPKYNFEYSTTRGFPHYIAQSQLQSTGQDPSSSSVILDISGLLTEDQLV
ncbi:hypothetical protein Q3G72_032456 [Acer saccharum]|nr:hypothetical protein Q3G72_032456 [Acer saccharum]